MLNGALARRYAQALFELADQMKVLDQIVAELRDFNDLLARNQEMRYVLNHPNISLTAKKDILKKVCPTYSDITLHFIYLLIDRRRQNLLALISKEFSRMADRARQIVEVKITSAVVLEPQQEEQISLMLREKTSSTIRLVTAVDETLIGGAKLQIGDRVIDGTVRAALKKIREELKKASTQPQQEVGVK